ncbi:hypothetical protein BDP27DRAFT_1547739 [Rhodocollybia butyracea]|uniref:DUF7702 domain-containing protein n=1 Tax=Rhodocollybia butyracea TaxID=206335 RepID=A0A9P5U5P6_9AGAR|nr:hypothetical protein BDP27DRAFT_1547739 [Rhodocollybia butyracea]
MSASSSDSDAPINYAALIGYKSIPAAVIFALCYLPLCIWFIPKLLTRRTYVISTLTLFCSMRLTAFILRVVLIASKNVGQDKNVLIVAEVFFSIGFFGLLFAAYGLVVDRLELCEARAPPKYENPFNLLTRNRRLFHLVAVAALIMGIIGITDSTGSSSSPSSSGTALRRASVAVFLVLTLVQAYQTFVLVRTERSENPILHAQNLGDSIGSTHGSIIFTVMAGLLIIREIYMVATIGSITLSNKEDMWYPLVALPELLCVALYVAPGVIPPPVPIAYASAISQYA